MDRSIDLAVQHIPNLSIRTLIAPSTKKPPRFYVQPSLVKCDLADCPTVPFFQRNDRVGSRDAYASKN